MGRLSSSRETTTAAAGMKKQQQQQQQQRLLTWKLLWLVLLLTNNRVQASIESTQLRRAATGAAALFSSSSTTSGDYDRLLFWSTYDHNIDAATQLFGPLDLVLRGGAAAGGDNEEQQQQKIDDEASTSLTSSAAVVIHDDDDDMDSVSSSVSSSTNTTATASSTTFRLTVNSTTRAAVSQDQDVDSAALLLLQDNQEQQLARVVATSFRSGAIPSSSSTTTTTHTTKQPEKLVYSLFQSNDGSETDPDGIPTRFVRMHPNDRAAAQQSLQDTLKWRHEHAIDDLLNQPQRKFDVAKAIFPHYFLGRDVINNRVVFVQRPARLDLARARANNLTEQDLLMHYVFCNEYLWQVLEGHNATSTMTSIIDLQGLNLGVLRKPDIISFVKKFVATMDSYYPQRAHKTLVLNAPKWFMTLYRILSPLLRETTKSKIEIHSRGKAQDEALKAILDEAALQVLPSSFWSSWKKPRRNKKRRFGGRRKPEKTTSGEEEKEGDEAEEEEEPDDGESTQSPATDMERELREFVVARIEAAGAQMQVVV